MATTSNPLTRWTNALLGRFGLEIQARAAGSAQVPTNGSAPLPESVEAAESVGEEEDGRDEGFAEYYAEAQRLGKDLNDYLEEDKNWGDCYHFLEATTFPYVQPDSIVLELGAGSGRWSRHLSGRLTTGELHLVDNSPWKVNFLRDYFHSDPHVHVHLNDGFSLGEFAEESVDLVCSYGTFIYFQLGQFYRYGQEFLRILRPGGHVVLDFIDIDTEPGWQWLEAHADENCAPCFTYYPPEVVEQVFQHVGFEIVKSRDYIEDFHYIVLRKPVQEPSSSDDPT